MSGNLAAVMQHAKRAQAEQNTQALEPELTVVKTKAAGMGKYRDPSFRKVTVYLREKTRKAAAVRLIEDGRELSEIVEQLLEGWTAGRIDA